MTTLLLSSPQLGFMPPSPDPTPLRMLAFSVAEAALDSNPNSPMMYQNRWSGSDWAVPSKSKSNLWDIVERAKERRHTESPSPPVSPDAYNFVLPSNGPLALAVASRPAFRRPLQTHSAEPSPVRSTFSTLDQSRPPPEFVPRLSAEEFCETSRKVSGRHTRTMSDSTRRSKAKLPSLKQIQAKMTAPKPRRSDSEDSLVLQTPTDEHTAIQFAAPAGKPSIAPFLRQRTSGRLALATPPKPVRPALTVTPPTFESRPAIPPLRLVSPTRVPLAVSPTVTTPTEKRFNLASRFSPRTPSSPTGSVGTGCSSPTLSVPIITCTPAPATVVRDGVEQDSDEEEDEVVVFDGEKEEMKEREERERRGQQMRERLSLRRGSD